MDFLLYYCKNYLMYFCLKHIIFISQRPYSDGHFDWHLNHRQIQLKTCQSHFWAVCAFGQTLSVGQSDLILPAKNSKPYASSSFQSYSMDQEPKELGCNFKNLSTFELVPLGTSTQVAVSYRHTQSTVLHFQVTPWNCVKRNLVLFSVWQPQQKEGQENSWTQKSNLCSNLCLASFKIGLLAHSQPNFMSLILSCSWFHEVAILAFSLQLAPHLPPWVEILR